MLMFGTNHQPPGTAAMPITCNRLSLLAVTVALLCGCSSPEGAIELGPPYDRVEAVTAKRLMPLPKRSGVVRVVDQAGRASEVSAWTQPEGPGTWRTSIEGFWTLTLVREASGAVSVMREVEHPENRYVDYSPPLAMMPGELKMGQAVERESRVAVYDLDSGVLQSSGPCRATYELLGSKRVDSGGGELTVYVVRTRREFDLPLVKVVMELVTGYEPGVGPVAQKVRRDVVLLGLIPVRREHRVDRLR